MLLLSEFQSLLPNYWLLKYDTTHFMRQGHGCQMEHCFCGGVLQQVCFWIGQLSSLPSPAGVLSPHLRRVPAEQKVRKEESLPVLPARSSGGTSPHPALRLAGAPRLCWGSGLCMWTDHTASLPGAPACRWQVVGRLSLHARASQLLITIYLSTYLSVYMYMYVCM